LALLSFILFTAFILSAHFNSGFSAENAKPTSLLYVLDADKKTALWATYENELSDWTAQYLGKNKKVPEKLGDISISSKYSTGFTFVSKAPFKEMEPPKIEKTGDTIIGQDRILEICITPKRNVNRLEVFSNDLPIKEASVNGMPLSKYYLENRRRGKLITHYISDNEYTELHLAIPRDSTLELILYEASNDLLGNPFFTIPQRPEENIPMPFVLNDAILVTKTIRFE
jgi:hypothetical protein